jgi:hypothetical protein
MNGCIDLKLSPGGQAPYFNPSEQFTPPVPGHSFLYRFGVINRLAQHEMPYRFHNIFVYSGALLQEDFDLSRTFGYEILGITLAVTLRLVVYASRQCAREKNNRYNQGFSHLDSQLSFYGELRTCSNRI